MDGALFHPGVERAIRVALEAHAGQTRKGEDTPYISHPVHVALLLARVGADEVTLQAALLHDVVEDCPGWTSARIGELFGEEVQAAVAHVTEAKGLKWAERKQAGVDHVAHMDLRATMLKAADKTHNLRSIIAKLDAAEDPATVWKPFSKGPREQVALARRLVEALEQRLEDLGAPGALARELRAALTALEAHVD